MTVFLWILVSDLQCFKKALCITHFVKGFHVYLMLKFVFMFYVGALNDSEAMSFLTQACRCSNTQKDNSV